MRTRVVVVSDSCHSGGMDKALGAGLLDPRWMPRSLYMEELSGETRVVEPGEGGEPVASVVFLHACEPLEYAVSLEGHGVFSRAVADAWERDDADSYPTLQQQLHDEVVGRLRAAGGPLMRPRLARRGSRLFSNRRPFS